MSFGQIIKKLRRNADMTQEALAEFLSISPQAVSRWETDTALPDISLLAPIANLFDDNNGLSSRCGYNEEKRTDQRNINCRKP